MLAGIFTDTFLPEPEPLPSVEKEKRVSHNGNQQEAGGHVQTLGTATLKLLIPRALARSARRILVLS